MRPSTAVLSQGKPSSAEAFVLLGTAIKDTRCNVHSKQNSAKLTFCPKVTASSAATHQNTNTTHLHNFSNGHQCCRTTAPAAASTPDCAAPAWRGATISAPLLACVSSLAPTPVSKGPRSRLTCIQGSSCDNTDKAFEWTHQLLRLLLRLTDQS